MASPQTAELLEFVTRSGSSDVPGEVLHQSKRCLLDFVGLVIGAVDEPTVTIPRSLYAGWGGDPQAAVLGTALRLRMTDAAEVNAIAAHALDYDDTHAPTILHGTTPVYGAALALAEWRGRSGLDLLAAHAFGFEAAARVALALYPAHYDIGWHMTGTAGVIGAAMAGARLLDLVGDPALNCLGVASTQAAGHRQHFGTMTKPFHAGHAARSGLVAALFAESGFTADADPLQGVRGMLPVMSSRFDPSLLTAGLGSTWELARNGVKPYACGVVTHPAIDAVRQVVAQCRAEGVAVERISRVELEVHPLVLELTNKTEPRTGLEGKFSVRFTCAIAALDGAAGPSAFTDANVTRPDVRSLMSRIGVAATSSLTHDQARATATTDDGQVRAVFIEHASGTPENPVSDAALAAKFHDLADPVLSAAQAAELEAAVWAIDGASDLSDLVRLATPAG